MHNVYGDLLFETRHGHALRCACCGRVQVQFRDHTLLIEADELLFLSQMARRALKRVREAEGPEKWRLEAETDAGTVTVVLTEPSLQALCRLLDGAQSMHELRRRVGAVHPDRPGEAREVVRGHVVGA